MGHITRGRQTIAMRLVLVASFLLSSLGLSAPAQVVQADEPRPTPTPTVMPAVPAIQRLSVTDQGGSANGWSKQPRFAADEPFVVFASSAANLVFGDTNATSDVFVKDLTTGAIERVSLGLGGVEANDYSDTPSVSGDGRLVAFRSAANNLIAADGSFEDVFVFDRLTEATVRVNEPAQAGEQPTCNSQRPILSADGRLVAFWSCADNLVSGLATSGTGQIYVRDLSLTATSVITPVSVSSSGVLGDESAEGFDFSADGRYVVFDSTARNLVAGDEALPVGLRQIFVRDLQTGVTSKASIGLVSAAPDDSSYAPALSADGRFVVFRSDATNLVADDTNATSDLFVYDRQTGTTERVSVQTGGAEANGPSWGGDISADGRFVSFVSYASNLDAADPDGTWSLFVHDRQTGMTRRMAAMMAHQLDPYGLPTPTDFDPQTGQLAFAALEGSLVSGDDNASDDIFVVDPVNFSQPSGIALPGSGTGLLAQYFNGFNLTGAPDVVRVDERVDFVWAEGSPDPSINVDGFAATWTGQLIPGYSEPTTVYAFSDERDRVYLGGQLILDQWTPHGPRAHASTPVLLTADVPVDLRVEYADDAGWSVVRLFWSSASQPLTVIPVSQFTPASSDGIETATPTTTPTGTLEPTATETATEEATATPSETATPEEPTQTPSATVDPAITPSASPQPEITTFQILMPGQSPAPVTPTGAPLAQRAGEPFEVTIRAVDEAWNTVSGYTGVFSLGSNYPAATNLPDDVQIVDGMATVTMTATRAASDFRLTVGGVVSGTETDILAADPADLTLALDPVISMPLQPFTLTVAVTDAFGNPIAASVTVSSSKRGSLPVDAITDGASNLVLYDPGLQTLTAAVVGYPGLQTTQVLNLSGDVVVTGSGATYSGQAPTVILPAGEYAYTSLTLQNQAGIQLRSDPVSGTGVRLSVERILLEANTVLDAVGQGYPAGQGPGAGPQSPGANSWQAGSHGGLGGGAISGTYGDANFPRTLGSGGVANAYAAPGGGAIEIQATDAITVNGAILASAQPASLPFAQFPASGGAGGSLLLEAPAVHGTGVLRADGGRGTIYGGGGGRIALRAPNVSNQLGVFAAGGLVSGGDGNGQSGTLTVVSVDTGLSTLTASSDDPTADGVSTAVVTVTLRTSANQPIVGQQVELRTAASAMIVNGAVIAANSYATIGQTDPSGVVTATLATTRAARHVIQARAGLVALAQTASVLFVPGAVDPARSMVRPWVQPIYVADGTTPITVTVYTIDSFGNAVPNVPVTLEVTGSGVVTPTSGTTNVSGFFQPLLTNAEPETVSISATVAGVVITDTFPVRFRGPNLVAQLAVQSATIDGPSTTATSPGERITYTVTLRNDGPVATRALTLTSTVPTGISVVSTSGSPAQTSPAVLWTLGELAPGATRTLSWTGLVAPSARGTLTTTVTAVDVLRDEVPADNIVSVATQVVLRRPILTLGPVDPNLQIAPETPTAVAFTVRNTGNLTATALSVSGLSQLGFATLGALGQTELAPGAETTVLVNLNPPAGLVDGYYRDTVQVSAANADTASSVLNLRSVRGLRSVVIGVGGYADAPLTDALVTLTKQTANADVRGATIATYTVRESRRTNASGQASFDQLETGAYDVSVSAPGYADRTGVLIVVAGPDKQAVTYTLQGQAALEVLPPSPTLFVLRGQTETVAITLRNTGTRTLTGIAVEAPAGLPWLTLATPDPLPNLEPGQTVSLILMATPPSGAVGRLFTSAMTVTANLVPTQILGIGVRLEQAPLQDLEFDVASAETGQRLPNGRVSLVAQSLTTATIGGVSTTYNSSFTADIGADGKARFDDIPSGTYDYVVEAEGYEPDAGEVIVRAQAVGAPDQVRAVSLAGLPFTFDWEVLPDQGGETALRLNLNYLTSTPRPEVLAFGHWHFRDCDSSVLLSSVTLVNPTDLELDLTQVEFQVPGVAVTLLEPVPDVLAPRSKVELDVRVTRVGPVGEGRAIIDFSYLGAPDNLPTISVNPLVVNIPFVPGEQFTRDFSLTGVIIPDDATYVLRVTQGQEQFAKLRMDDYFLDKGETLTGDILVTTPEDLGPGQPSVDEIKIELTGSTGIRLTGLLRVEMLQDIAGDWIFNASYSWQTPDNLTKTRTSRSSLTAVATGCDIARQGAPVVAGFAAGGPTTITWPASFVGRIGLPGAPWPGIGNDHQQVQLVIDQKVLVAGQSTRINVNFENGPLPVTDLQFDVIFTDTTAPGVPVTGFVVDPLVPTDLPNLGSGQARDHSWLIVPTAELGVTSPNGRAYRVSGVIRYSVSGVPYEFISAPQTIVVYPKPNLRITYRLPQPNQVATAFELRADIVNLGPGIARDLRITTQQPVVVGNVSGIPIGFTIADTTLDGSSLGPVFNPSLGNLAPGQMKTIVWRIGSSVPGRFTQFHVDLSGATWNGKPLPATIQEVNTIYNDPDPDPDPAQLPVIFVPGIGGTQLFQQVPLALDPELWLPLAEVFVSPSDHFLRPLGLAANGSDPFNSSWIIYPYRVMLDAAVGDGTLGYLSLDVYAGFVRYMTAADRLSPTIADDYPQLTPYVLGEVGQDTSDSASWYNHVIDYQPGQNLWLFPVDFRMHLPTQADRLNVLIDDVLAATGASQVQLVGHSQGGLIIRDYIADATRAAKVEQVVTLGTPYLGSPNGFEGLRYGLKFLNVTIVSGPVGSLRIVTNPATMKELIQNWPGGLELLPANQAYFDVLAAHNAPTGGAGKSLGYFSALRDLNGDGVDEGDLIDWSTMSALLTAPAITDYERTYLGIYSYSVPAYNADLINQAATFQADGIAAWQTSTVPRTQIVSTGLCTSGRFIEYPVWPSPGVQVIKVRVIPTLGDGTVPVWSAGMGDGLSADFSGGATVLYAWQGGTPQDAQPTGLAGGGAPE